MKKKQIVFILLYGFLSMTIISIVIPLLTSKSETSINQVTHPRAFIIGIDGIGNLPQTAETPGIHRVINNGVYTYEAQTVHPSLSRESWTSLFHGVGPTKHKMYSTFGVRTTPNSSYPLTSPYPSLYRLIHEQHKSAKTACFSNWYFITKFIIEDEIGVFKYFKTSEKKVVDTFEKYMKKNDPWLVFFQLDATDEAGHKFGYFSDGQKKQLRKTDRSVSRIIDIIEKYDANSESLILILTDHGGGGNYFSENNIQKPDYYCDKCMHGSKEPCDMTIFWTARGKNICKNKKISHNVSIVDSARFVASFLNLKIPETWDGYNLYPELLC